MKAGTKVAAPRAAGATLETCLADARAGKPQPVYLFDGDAFLALRAARAQTRAVSVAPMLLESERLLVKGDLVFEAGNG